MAITLVGPKDKEFKEQVRVVAYQEVSSQQQPLWLEFQLGVLTFYELSL